MKNCTYNKNEKQATFGKRFAKGWKIVFFDGKTIHRWFFRRSEIEKCFGDYPRPEKKMRKDYVGFAPKRASDVFFDYLQYGGD